MALSRAREIIGESRDNYQCNHVVNYVVNGDKNVGGRARDYLNYYRKVSVKIRFSFSFIYYFVSKGTTSIRCRRW